MAALKFVSLFCGAGGLDLGFIDAGFRPAAAYDISEHAVAHYAANVGDHAQVADLSQEDFRLEECDIVLAGSPCQGFSTLGKRNPSDPRNLLLNRAAELAISARPKVIVLENVPGLVSGSFVSHLERALSKLERAGYKSVTRLVDAQVCGLAQTRKRLVVIAARGKFNFSRDMKRSKPKRLADVLSAAWRASSHDPRMLSGVNLLIAKRIAAGQKLCDVRGGSSAVHSWTIPEVFGSVTRVEVKLLETTLRLRRRQRVREIGDGDPVTIRRLLDEAGVGSSRVVESLLKKGYLKAIGDKVDIKRTFNGKFRRPIDSSLSPTVDTRFCDPKCFLHPRKHRGFTVREAARIQGFPDGYKFSMSNDISLQLIGNAVPPPMGYAIAKLVSSGLKG